MMGSPRTLMMGTECVRLQVKDDPDEFPSVPPGFAPLGSFPMQRVQVDVNSSAIAHDSIQCNTGDAKSRKSLPLRPEDKDDPDEFPSIPPGFASLTSFTLQRVEDDAKCSANAPDLIQCISGDVKSRKSLRQRPWVNYSMFDNSSDEESDYEHFEKDMPSTQSLPKGVIRGCSECENCHKVTAKWRPQDACRPILDEAPVFYPSEEEFSDTLNYIASIQPIAEQYGICRIVPPSSWRPPCLLKEKDVWENSKFATRIQQVDKLQNRGSLKKISKTHSSMKRKRQKLFKMGDNSNENMAEVNKQRYNYGSERFGFVPGPNFTLDSFQKYADDFKEQYFRTNVDLDLRSVQHEPSLENIEGEYWRIVERPTEEIEVLYGADLDTGAFGSGFPKASSSLKDSELDRQYVSSGWNLNNLARLPGSVLSFESGDISGVLVPWLYVGMCFSSFCWHVEDHHLYSLNYLHWGAPKLWYGVPGKDASKLEEAMKKLLPNLFEEQPDLLHNLVTQCSPSLLRRESVPVYRCVQNAGEFVLTFPRAYHSGFNCGFNCAEAVNVAPIDWLPNGQNAVELYREEGRKISISHDKLLLGAAREAVRAQWKISFLGQRTADNLRWKNFCGPDGILAKALKARVDMERVRREYLCSSQSRKMDADFDADSERECFLCHYDLHLSAASCPCSPDRFACLVHANQLCSCDWGIRIFLFRYEISELNILMDALGGKLSQVHKWGLSDLGLSLSSFIMKEKGEKMKAAGMANKEVREQKDNGANNQGNTTGNARLNLSNETNSSKLQKSSVVSLKEREDKVHNSADLECTNGDRSPLQQAKSVTPSVTKYPCLREDKACQLREGHKRSNVSLEFPGQQFLLRSTVSTPSLQSNSGEAKHLITSLTATTEKEKNFPSVDMESISLGGNEHKGASRLVSDKMTVEPLAKDSEIVSRLTNSVDKATFCNSCKDQSLLTPQTKASSLNEEDVDLLPTLETSGINSHLALSDTKGHEGSFKKDLFDLPDQKSIKPFAQITSDCVASATLTISKPISDVLARKGSCDGDSASGHLPLPQISESGKLDDATKQCKESDSESNLMERGNSVTAGPSCVQNNLDKCSRQQKGPRMAKVVRRINCSVEASEYGVVLSGKLWSTNQAIFPKGYRSRVRYFSILDPTQMCYYLSEILDAGLLGPLFMVVVEQSPSEVFIHVSAARCWDMVRERVNLEIMKQHDRGRTNLPSLQLPGSIDGLEMFGLSSPAIIQAIEALDRNRVCTEYWRAKPNTPAPPFPLTIKDHASPLKNDQGTGGCSSSASSVVLQGFFKKANLEELHALHSLLSNDVPHNSTQELIQLLDDEINSRYA